MNTIRSTKRAVLGSMALVIMLGVNVTAAALAADPDPDRYIVSFLDVGKGKAALKAAGARIELDLPNHEAAAVHIPSRALQGLRRNPNIEYIEKDVLRYPMAQTTPWGIPAVQADQVTEGAARKICIIDSGYSDGHEDLPQAYDGNVSGSDISKSNFWDDDSCYHGTHVAGTIAALDNITGVKGVLPGDTIGLYIVKVFDGANCAWAYSSSLVDALDDCIANGANIVSMSLGGSFKSRTEQRAFGSAYNNNDVLSVAAAGNGGNNRKSYPASYDSVISVAAVDSAREIAAFSQQNDQVELAAPGVAVRSTVKMTAGLEESLVVGLTTYEATGMEGSAVGSVTAALFECSGVGGPGDCAGANGLVCLIQRGDITFAEKVQECENKHGVAAVIYNNADALFSGTLGGVATAIPSVGISGNDGAQLAAGQSATVTVASGNYAFYDGTSMATPHVSGVAALVWSQDTNCTNSEIRSALTGTAIDLGVSGRDTAFGYGLIQAKDAVDLLAQQSCSGGGGGNINPTCGPQPKGASCNIDEDCSSCTCKGRPSAKTCK